MNPNDQQATDHKPEHPKITAEKAMVGPVEALGSIDSKIILTLAEHWSAAASAAAISADPSPEAAASGILSSGQRTRGLLYAPLVRESDQQGFAALDRDRIERKSGGDAREWTTRVDLMPKQDNGKVIVFALGYPPMMDLCLGFMETFRDAGFRVLAIDTNREQGSIANVVEDKANTLFSYIREKSIASVDWLIGYSEGALYGVQTAFTNPSLFKNILVLDGAGLVNLRTTDYIGRLTEIVLKGLMNDKTRETFTAVIQDYLNLAANSPIRYIQTCNAILNENILPYLSDLHQNHRINIVFYHGELDSLFTVEEVRAAIARFDFLTLNVISDVDHFSTVLAAAETAQALLKTLLAPVAAEGSVSPP
jgi:predicted esterase